MVYRKAVAGLMIAMLAGCSVAEEDDRQTAQERDIFERRNVAPDPAQSRACLCEDSAQLHQQAISQQDKPCVEQRGRCGGAVKADSGLLRLL